MYFASQSKTMVIVDCWRCQLRVIKMPSHGVGDAFYGVIVGFTHSVSSHPILSWKVSERPLVGIVISILPILQCLDSNVKNQFKNQKKCCKFTSTSTKSSEIIVFIMVSRGGGEFFTSTSLPPFGQRKRFLTPRKVRLNPKKSKANPEKWLTKLGVYPVQTHSLLSLNSQFTLSKLTVCPV